MKILLSESFLTENDNENNLYHVDIKEALDYVQDELAKKNLILNPRQIASVIEGGKAPEGQELDLHMTTYKAIAEKTHIQLYTMPSGKVELNFYTS